MPNKPKKPTPGRLVDFSGGQNDAIDPDLLNDNESVLLQCATLDQKGTLMPDKGADNRFASDFDAANPVNGIGAFVKSDETTRLVMGAGTKVYKDSPHVIKMFDTQTDWDSGVIKCNIDTGATVGSIKLCAKPTNVFDRETVAYNEDGTQVAIDVPRYKAGKFSNGYWGEEFSQNVLTQSEDFSHADWTKRLGTAVTANTTAAPNGTTTADTVEDNSTTEYGGVQQYKTCADSETWTVSLFIKKDATTNRFPEMGLDFEGGTTLLYYRIQLNTSTGATTTRSDGANATVTVREIAGYWRLTITGTNNATGNTSVRFIFHPAVTATWGSVEATATGSCIIWGAQLEKKSYPTSYIATTTAAVTRNADQLYYTLTNALPAKNFGCLWWKPDHASTACIDETLAWVMNNSSVWRYLLQYYSGKFLFKKNDGVTVYACESAATSFAAGDNIFVAWADDPVTGNMKLWVGINGAAIAEYTLANTVQITDAQKVYVGCRDIAGITEANGVEDAVQLIDVNALEASGTTFNSTFVNNQYTATGAPTSTPAHLLLANMDSAITAADLTGGVWISPWQDVSQASNTGSGVMTWDSTLPAGTSLTVKARSSADQTTVTAWATEANGALMTTPHNTYVQIANVFSRTDTAQNPSVEKTTLSYDGTPSATELITGLTAGGNVYMDTLLDTLMIVNGIDVPKKWDGTAAAADLGGTPPRGEYIAVHKNRVFMLIKSRLYFSDVLNNESWPVLNFIDISPNDGDRGTGLLRNSDYLVMTKRRSIHLLVGDSTSNFAVRRLQSNTGCVAPRSLCLVNELVSFVGHDGVYFSDLSSVTLASERMKTTWAGLNQRRLSQCSSSFHNHILRISAPNGQSTYNNIIMEYDTIRQAWKTRNDWRVSCWTKFLEAGKEVLLFGHSQKGQVQEIEKGYANNGIGLNFEWQSKHFHFGVPERIKRWPKVYLMVKPYTTDVPINIYFTVDGGTFSSPITKTIPGRSDDKIETVLLRPASVGVLRGHSIGLKITQNTANAVVGIHSLVLPFAVKGERATI